jgi:hypothetical protein
LAIEEVLNEKRREFMVSLDSLQRKQQMDSVQRKQVGRARDL